MSERSLHVKVPLKRVGVLIGSTGFVKKVIEEKLRIKMDVDSEFGDVTLTSSDPDPSLLFRSRDLVMAIGRGFSPEKAFTLFDEDVSLLIIDLQDFFRSPSDIQRVKSRIIGTKGKTRRIIEEETMTSLSIYGDTISIIGDIEHLKVAKEAVDMFIRGAHHRSVYRYLNMKRNELRKIEMELWKSPP